MPLRLVPPVPLPTRPTELSAAELNRAGAGDPAAMRAFVGCYERRVFTVCARLLGDRSAAEDAAQETFLKALGALSRFDPHGAAQPSTWLLTIATHHCLDELRKRRRRPAFDHNEVQFARAVADSDTAVIVNQAASAQAVELALHRLSDEHRAVVVLRILAEASVEETASILGVETGTVKSRLARAKAALKAAMQGASS